jgi:DNA-binding response OmpR family regulator
MMEFALKAKGAEIYTVATLENNFYLLDDLIPDLILFDVKTIQNDLENLKKYKEKALFVAVGDEEDRIKAKSLTDIFLLKPIEAKNIANRLLGLLD